MRAVVQRVKSASVSIAGERYSEIGDGFTILLGISTDDDRKDIEYIVNKVLNLRIFSDDEGKMNLSLLDRGYELLVVSQFTLYGDARKGRRPSFSRSAPPSKAEKIYYEFIEILKEKYSSERVKTGVFQEMMDVELINNGPVTLLLDSERKF